MKIIRENINFERNTDPKKSMNTGIIQTLKDLGVRIWENNEENVENIYSNIQEIYEFIELIHKRGVQYKDIEIDGPKDLEINGFKVKDTNVVLVNCLTEKDAQEIIKTLNKTIPTRYPDQLHYESDSGIFITISEHTKKWLKGEVN